MVYSLEFTWSATTVSLPVYFLLLSWSTVSSACCRTFCKNKLDLTWVDWWGAAPPAPKIPHQQFVLAVRGGDTPWYIRLIPAALNQHTSHTRITGRTRQAVEQTLDALCVLRKNFEKPMKCNLDLWCATFISQIHSESRLSVEGTCMMAIIMFVFSLSIKNETNTQSFIINSFTHYLHINQLIVYFIQK